MFTIPPHFYYEENHIAIQYGNEVQGTPHIPHLLENKPAYPKLQEGHLPRKKFLLLDFDQNLDLIPDPNKHITSESPINPFPYLEFLLKEGFEMGMILFNTLYKIRTPDDLACAIAISRSEIALRYTPSVCDELPYSPNQVHILKYEELTLKKEPLPVTSIKKDDLSQTTQECLNPSPESNKILYILSDDYEKVRTNKIFLNQPSKLMALFLYYKCSNEQLNALLKPLSRLRILNLSRLRFFDGENNIPLRLPASLVFLDLSCTKLSVQQWNQLVPSLPQLRYLALSENQTLFQGENIPLQLPASLVFLDLRYTWFSAQQWNQLVPSLPQLRGLNLSGNPTLFQDNNIPLQLPASLVSLNLYSTNLSTQQWNALVSQLSQLRSLNLGYNKSLFQDDNIPLQLPASLVFLDLMNTNLSTQQWNDLVPSLPQLRSLNLGCNDTLFEKESVPLRLPKGLIELDLFYCEVLSNHQLMALLYQVPHLQKLNIQYCSSLTEAILAELPSSLQVDSNFDKKCGFNSSPSMPALLPPVHDPLQLLNFQAPSADIHFRNIKDRLSQDMIIDKLLRYHCHIKKNPIPLEQIITIKKGICVHLAVLYKNHTPEAWKTLLETIRDWDGQEASVSTSLVGIFEQINRSLDEEAALQALSFHYFTKYILLLINTLLAAKGPQSFQPFYLRNPWHRIALRHQDNEEWDLYDPNHPEGNRKVSNESLFSQITLILGQHVFIEAFFIGDYDDDLSFLIEDSHSFFATGGLLALLKSSPKSQTLLLNELQEKVKSVDYDEPLLRGLCLRNTACSPAWLEGLKFPQPEIKKLTVFLLNQLATHLPPPNFKQTLQHSLSALNSTQTQEAISLLSSVWQARPAELEVPILSGSAASVPATVPSSEVPIVSPPPFSFDDILANLEKQQEDKKVAELRQAYLKRGQLHVQGPSELFAYSQFLLNDNLEKQLIVFKNTACIPALMWQLQEQAKSSGRKLFSAFHPEQLIFANSCLIPEPAPPYYAKIQEGLSGAFYSFLFQETTVITSESKSDESPPLELHYLLIDFTAFSSEDLNRFNSLFDDKPMLQGLPLPATLRIIGFIKEGAYDPSFSSRFKNNISLCPVPAAAFSQTSTGLLPMELLNEAPVYWSPYTPQILLPDPLMPSALEIELYEADNWKERLIGHWSIQGKGLIPKAENAEQLCAYLATHLVDTHPVLKLKNPPLWDKAFRRFWEDLAQYQRLETLRGPQRFSQPILFSLILQKGYDWNSLAQPIQCFQKDYLTPEEAAYLNPTTFPSFLKQHHFKKPDLLYEGAGLIEKRKAALSDMKTLPVHLNFAIQGPSVGVQISVNGPLLRINVTRGLNLHQWAELLNEAGKAQLVLDIYAAHGVSLPPALETVLQETNKWRATPPALPERQAPKVQVEIIISEDAELEARRFNSQFKNTASQPWRILYAAQDAVSDLLPGTELIPSTGPFLLSSLRFQELKGGLEHLFLQGEKVILIGQFSPLLADCLRPFLLQAYWAEHLKIIIDPKTQPLFSSLTVKIGFVAPPHYKSWAQRKAEFELRVRTGNIEANPWAGLEDLTPAPPLAISLDDNSNTEAVIEAEAKAFLKKRCEEVNRILSFYPILFISGLSGVGKTTFFQDDFKHYSSLPFEQNLHLGNDDKTLLDWIQDPIIAEGGRSILLMDEGNLLLNYRWSRFKTLFHDKPYVIINKIPYLLTSQHKLLVLGNPLHYGNNRTLPELFQTHGGSLAFEPLPWSVICYKVLIPLFRDSVLKTCAIVLRGCLSKIYEAFCFYSFAVGDLLMTARELRTLFLFLETTCLSVSFDPMPISLFSPLKKMLYDIVFQWVPTQFKPDFETKFKSFLVDRSPFRRCSVSPPTLLPSQQKDSTILLDSQAPAREMIQHFLALRKRQLDELTQTRKISSRYTDGLGGLILEGPPSVGKSTLLLFLLEKEGYQKETDFIHLSVGMNTEMKQKALTHAFEQGLIVIVDEINAAPFMESHLNSFLMGKNLKGTPPAKPGFLLLGTQNPFNQYDGRHEASTAFKRRVVTLLLPCLTQQEVYNILIHRNIEEQKAKITAQAFVQARPFNPNLTLRALS